MGIIVGRGYSYVECDSTGCRNRTRDVTGENDGQGDVNKVARRSGWRISYENGHATCPECWTKEAHHLQSH